MVNFIYAGGKVCGIISVIEESRARSAFLKQEIDPLEVFEIMDSFGDKKKVNYQQD